MWGKKINFITVWRHLLGSALQKMGELNYFDIASKKINISGQNISM